MAFVLDVSLTASWCFVDEKSPLGDEALLELQRSFAEVPALWPFEIFNVLALNERKGRISQSGSEEFMRRMSSLDIRVDFPPQIAVHPEWFALTRQHRLTAYDASYLELAKRSGLPLATLDTELIRAAASEGVRLWRPA